MTFFFLLLAVLAGGMVATQGVVNGVRYRFVSKVPLRNFNKNNALHQSNSITH